MKCLLHSNGKLDDHGTDDKGKCSEDEVFLVQEDSEEDVKTPESPQVEFLYTKAAYQQGILIQPGIPEQFSEAFHDVCSDFTVPHYNLSYIQSIVSGAFPSMEIT